MTSRTKRRRITRPNAFLRDAAAETILTNTTNQSSLHLRFFGTPVSSAASLSPVFSDGTKLGLERSTSKMTSESVATRASACTYKSEKAVSVLAFLWDASNFGRFLASRNFRRHQAGFGTEHFKNDIRECCYPGKRMRPDATRSVCLFRRTYKGEKAVPVPQAFHFLHPAARASGRVLSCWWGRSRCTIGNVEPKQACVLAQSFQQ
jgi:hypothetical protein